MTAVGCRSANRTHAGTFSSAWCTGFLLLLQVNDYSAPLHLSSRSAYMSRSVGALSLRA